ncbi:MAG: hypothetical protein RMJ66_00225 [Bacteroidia bacterium]|nr:hypothetical protein [Bacteroidia bacterium]
MRWLVWGLALGWSQSFSLPEIERRLAHLGQIILHHDSLPLKDSLNRLFLQLWHEVFSHPEAFGYPFDSVVTVSDLCPPDSAFRIITWQIVDFSHRRHRYYGILVRRWREHKKAPWKVRVFELKALPNILEQEDIERCTLSPTEWVGALYYHPRYSTHGVLRYTSTALVPRGTKRVRESMVYYVLLGWNGYDHKRNFKVIETVFFDPKNPSQAYFGVPIIYAGAVPKMRLLLEYAETTPLSLNLGWYVKRVGAKKRYTAIIFDHISYSSRSKRMYEDARPFFGADGTYDAIEYWKKGRFEGRKGILVYRRNVVPYAPDIEEYDPRVILHQQREARKKLEQYELAY